MEEKNKKNIIIIKRALSSLIDVAFVMLGLYLAYKFSKYDLVSKIDFFTLFFITYTCTTSLGIIGSGYGTPGDVFMRLKSVNLDGTQSKWYILILRNFCWCLLVNQFGEYNSDKFSFFIGITLFICLYFPIFSNKNKYGEYMTATDMLFKVKVVLMENQLNK